mgnify:FL=1
MPCRVAICDDDKNQLNSLQSVIEKWGRISGSSCEVSVFPSAEAFLFAYEEDKHWDILLLDVEMEGMSGMGLARRVRQDNLRAEIIFVTSHFEFVSEGYEVDALHYLTKPVPEDKLMEVLDKAGERLAAEPPSQVITCEGETVKLYERDILYVESFRHYISIHTKDREYKIKENISAFEERLRGGFFRIHRSYLVNLKYVIRIGRTAVTVEGGEELPLARGRYDQVNRAFIQEN